MNAESDYGDAIQVSRQMVGEAAVPEVQPSDARPHRERVGAGQELHFHALSIHSGYPYLVRIGDNCSIASNVRLLAHDATTFKFTGGHTRPGKIVIKDNCFIGENSIVLPGATIGPNVLVAAGSVVNRDVPPNSCVAGVPARVYAKFDAFIERHEQQLSERQVFELSALHPEPGELTKKMAMESVQDGDSYVSSSLNDRYTLNRDWPVEKASDVAAELLRR